MKYAICFDGVKLFVEDIGDTKLRPILFIHGIRQCHLVWKYQIESLKLKRNFRLITFDLRGHGESDKPKDVSFYQDPKIWADDIKTIIDSCQLNKPIICAWSSGATFLCDYIKYHGIDNIGGIILVNPYTYSSGISEQQQKMYLNLMSENFIIKQKAIEEFVRLLTTIPLSKDIFESFVRFNTEMPNEAIYGLYRINPNYAQSLSKIKCPGCVIYGNNDKFISIDDAKKNAIDMKGEFVVYENIGHSPFIECPTKFNNDIYAFALKYNLINTPISSSIGQTWLAHNSLPKHYDTQQISSGNEHNQIKARL